MHIRKSISFYIISDHNKIDIFCTAAVRLFKSVSDFSLSLGWTKTRNYQHLPKMPMKLELMSDVFIDYIVWLHHQSLIFGLHQQTDVNCMLLCHHAFNWQYTAAHSLKLTVCRTCFLQSHMQAAMLGHTWTLSGTTCQMKLDFAVKSAHVPALAGASSMKTFPTFLFNAN